MSEVVVGEDGVARCSWGASTPDYRDYHDREWGRPVGDEARVYEKLCLEGFQAGLSWLTILRKRDGFRAAFDGFDPVRVAQFGDKDVDRLMADAGIVRNRAKILATIANAQAVLALRAEGRSLPGLLWAHEPGRRATPTSTGDLPASTDESKALSKALLKLGFRFVGPTTVYAAMQSLGIVNDHVKGCHARDACVAARAEFTPPR